MRHQRAVLGIGSQPQGPTCFGAMLALRAEQTNHPARLGRRADPSIRSLHSFVAHGLHVYASVSAPFAYCPACLLAGSSSTVVSALLV